MSIILTIIVVLFLIKILRDSLHFIWLWQRKEYRIDRMVSHLKEDMPPAVDSLSYVFAAVVFLLRFVFLENGLLVYLVLLFLVFSVFRILKEAKKRSFKRPKLTLKTALIFLTAAAFYLSLSVLYLASTSADAAKLGVAAAEGTKRLILFLVLLLYLAAPALITVAVLFINPIFDFQKRRIIKKACEKMSRLRRVKVIGITGSFGKTSTKEFLYAILARKYKVVKTKGNNNTNIGVAYTVLDKVSDEYDYFICEMGAYRIGEIREICNIVKPEIGIITGINEQHIDLFGSQENIIRTKLELIESLPEAALAVINSKIKTQVLELQSQNSSRFGTKNLRYFSLDNIKDVRVFPDYTEFAYKASRSERLIKFKLNIPGKHYVENVLSAIIVAEYLGMDLEEIKRAVERISPTEYMMRKIKGFKNSIFIDDSYSANSDGVTAALDYLDEAYQGFERIIVFPGIIELGKEREKVHRKLFDEIGKICNIAYILKTQNLKLIPQNSRCKFIFEEDFDKVAEMLKNNLKEKTVVLFESRGARVVMEKVRGNKRE